MGMVDGTGELRTLDCEWVRSRATSGTMSRSSRSGLDTWNKQKTVEIKGTTFLLQSSNFRTSPEERLFSSQKFLDSNQSWGERPQPKTFLTRVTFSS